MLPWKSTVPPKASSFFPLLYAPHPAAWGQGVSERRPDALSHYCSFTACNPIVLAGELVPPSHNRTEAGAELGCHHGRGVPQHHPGARDVDDFYKAQDIPERPPKTPRINGREGQTPFSTLYP